MKASWAFEISNEDIIEVLGQMTKGAIDPAKISVDDERIDRVSAYLDHNLVAESALQGNDLEEQAYLARESIASQVRKQALLKAFWHGEQPPSAGHSRNPGNLVVPGSESSKVGQTRRQVLIDAGIPAYELSRVESDHRLDETDENEGAPLALDQAFDWAKTPQEKAYWHRWWLYLNGSIGWAPKSPA